MGGEYRAGDVVDGRFVLEEQLGSGGMGRVWRAHHRHLEIDVALKQLLVATTGTAEVPEELVARARREGRTLARLPPHPGIVSVRDLITVDGLPWLVMELIEGRSLKETVHRDGPLTEDRTAALAEQLLTALTFVHAHGVLHRDLKPGNILIDAAGDATLVDFGIAVHADDTTLTQSGALIGTPGYLDPERLRGQAPTEASDLFCLAATLYFAHRGRGPFHRDNPGATVHATLYERPLFEPGSGLLAELLEALLAPAAADRPTAEQALDRLRAMRPPVPAQHSATEAGVDDAPGEGRSRQGAVDVKPTSPAPSAVTRDDRPEATEHAGAADSPEPRRWWPHVVQSTLGLLAFFLPLTLGMGAAHSAADGSYLTGASLLPLGIAAAVTVAGMKITRCSEVVAFPLLFEMITLLVGLPIGLVLGGILGDFYAGAVLGSAACGALGANLGGGRIEQQNDSWAVDTVLTLLIAAVWIALIETTGYLTQRWAVHSAVGYLDTWAGGLVHLLS
ncbi:serine/threonine protein kinase [Actinoallomurus spadix]|uniref:non-specific serine/threonine protein kinase n=1 Tax=Actinoallomurus spadix TaxID=79912 RepID=A0ABN0XRV5_9ACTN|nr:serine/threonine-protein kinase [Actinoallomurus spadix]MCO5990266.1 serine/threonine protein kinase [Actinoallomurus spadix]